MTSKNESCDEKAEKKIETTCPKIQTKYGNRDCFIELLMKHIDTSVRSNFLTSHNTSVVAPRKEIVNSASQGKPMNKR